MLLGTRLMDCEKWRLVVIMEGGQKACKAVKLVLYSGLTSPNTLYKISTCR